MTTDYNTIMNLSLQ